MNKEIPQSLFKLLDLSNQEKKISGVLDSGTKLYVTQVKFISDIHKITPFDEIELFTGSSYDAPGKSIIKGLFFTNGVNVCNELKNDKYVIVTRESFINYDSHFWDNVRMVLNGHLPSNSRMLTPPRVRAELSELCTSLNMSIIDDRAVPCGKSELASQVFMDSKTITVIAPEILLSQWEGMKGMKVITSKFPSIYERGDR